MFDFVRTHNRWLQLGLLVLILPSFVVFGIQGYSRFADGANASVASVDGQSITQAEWDASHQSQVERIRRQSPQADVKLFDTPAARAQTLEVLVRERVLRAAATEAHLAVTDERLKRNFANDPQFASVRNADGSVNKLLLSAQGMSSEMFVAKLRQEMLLQQVLGGVSGSVLAANAVSGIGLDALLQRRVLQMAHFDAKDQVAALQPTEVELQAYFKAHEANFRAPEQAVIDYLVLDLEVLKKGLSVAEDELRKYYAENASRYTAKEERRARHILVKVEADAAADVKQKAKAKAEALLAEARKSPAGFAELAKKNSDDTGSAANGGDLEFFGRGAMVKAFDDAAFAMKPGEISNLVETEFGWHIIKLEAIKGGDKRPFDEVRSSVEDEVKKQLASKRWAEAAEQFTNTVYEQSDSLQPAMDKLKLDKRSATVQRTPAAGAPAVLASPKLLEAIFGKEVLQNKRNTDAIEVGPNQLAAARVSEYRPARTLAFKEVQDAVRQGLLAEQAMALARKAGEALLAQSKADPSSAKLPLAATVSRNKPAGLPASALNAVLGADTSKLPALLGVELPGQGYLVARILQVLPRDLPANENAELQGQYAQAWARAESEAYYQALKVREKTEVKVRLPAN